LHVDGARATAPTILLSNHLSWIDIPALAAATGTVFVAHSGLAEHPAMRFLCNLHRTVFITRNNRASVTGQIDQVRDGLRESGVLALFPEGTTGDGPALLPFKSSLLAALERSTYAVAIRPVCIDFGDQTRQLAWVGDEPGLQNFKRVLAKREGLIVRVCILPPLSGADLTDRKSIAAAAHAAIAAELDQRVAL
jgi:1-acyl-sn-glycerol-3-phosphate acyltransferase